MCITLPISIRHAERYFNFFAKAHAHKLVVVQRNLTPERQTGLIFLLFTFKGTTGYQTVTSIRDCNLHRTSLIFYRQKVSMVMSNFAVQQTYEQVLATNHYLNIAQAQSSSYNNSVFGYGQQGFSQGTNSLPAVNLSSPQFIQPIVTTPNTGRIQQPTQYSTTSSQGSLQVSGTFQAVNLRQGGRFGVKGQGESYNSACCLSLNPTLGSGCRVTPDSSRFEQNQNPISITNSTSLQSDYCNSENLPSSVNQSSQEDRNRTPNRTQRTSPSSVTMYSADRGHKRHYGYGDYSPRRKRQRSNEEAPAGYYQYATKPPSMPSYPSQQTNRSNPPQRSYAYSIHRPITADDHEMSRLYSPPSRLQVQSSRRQTSSPLLLQTNPQYTPDARELSRPYSPTIRLQIRGSRRQPSPLLQQSNPQISLYQRSLSTSSLQSVNQISHPETRNMQRSTPLVQMPHESPVPPPGFTGFERMSEEIQEYYNSHKQTEELFQKKLKLRNALYSILNNIFPESGLFVVGSSMNGFGGRTSDMDMCMVVHGKINQKFEATEILRVIHKVLRKCPFIKRANVIKAKVPILKFEDNMSGIECDINVNNTVGIRNTHLLGFYGKADSRVRPLVLYVKAWAKFHNINDASRCTISSYSLVQMVLHYLQSCIPPVLPSLQEKFATKFDVSVEITRLSLQESVPPYNSLNKQSLGELFLGFLEYYSEKFNFDSDAISVRLGRKVPIDLVINQSRQSPTYNPRQWKCLCIEEPFDLSNTARSVYCEQTFLRVKRVIARSYHVLKKTKRLESIMSEAF